MKCDKCLDAFLLYGPITWLIYGLVQSGSEVRGLPLVFIFVMFFRFSTFCYGPALKTWTATPSLSPAARPAEHSRRFSVGGVSVGAWILRVGRWGAHVAPHVHLDVPPPARGSETQLLRREPTWRPALRSTSQHVQRRGTSCRCSASAHAASVWIRRDGAPQLRQQGELSPVRLHNMSNTRVILIGGAAFCCGRGQQ